MAAPRPKSPGPRGPSKKDDKEESFWEKIGTLGRKKGIKKGMHYFKLLRFLWFPLHVLVWYGRVTFEWAGTSVECFPLCIISFKSVFNKFELFITLT